MRIKPTVASVVGETTPEAWGQVLITPTAWGVVEITDSAGIARDLGVRLLTRLAQKLNIVPPSLTGLAQIADEFSRDPTVQTLILLLPVGKILYLVLRGRGSVYLKRGEQLAELLTASGEISGEAKLGDSLLLASKGLSEALPKREIEGVFDHAPVTDVAEKLTLALHEYSGSVGAAALIWQVADFFASEAEEPSTTQVDLPRPLALRVLNRIRQRRWPTPTGIKRRIFRLRHQPRLLLIMVSGVLLLLFVVSIILGIQKQVSNKQVKAAAAALVEAQQAYDEGLALRGLNTLKSRDKLNQAKNILAPWGKLSPRSPEGYKIANLTKQVEETLLLTLQITKSQPQLFYDAALLKAGSHITNLAAEGNRLILLDGDTRTVYLLQLNNKQGEIVAGGSDFLNASAVSLNGDMAYVLTASGINQINLSEKKATPGIIKTDKTWGQISGLAAFAGNLYLADSKTSRIWKYVATEKGFSELREYLNPDTLPDLTAVINMAIDGNVWLGSNNGRIWRFSLGRETTFAPVGVEPALGQNLMVTTSDSEKNLYVLDGQNKRVVVLDKEGIYLAQYIWETNLVASDLAVSENQKKIFLLADGKIYSLDLR